MIKTDKNLVEKVRDNVAGRIQENKLDVLYWEEILKKAKQNTQEAVDCSTHIKNKNIAIKKDKVFLKIIDRKLRKMK